MKEGEQKLQSIVIFASGSTEWIGGIYYAKNIAFQLATNHEVISAYKIYLCVPSKYSSEFDGLPDAIKIIPMRSLPGKLMGLRKLLFCITHSAKFVMYGGTKYMKIFGITRINWYPDFQAKHMPECFSQQELMKRDITCRKYAQAPEPLVLSSYDALRDFREFYSSTKSNVIVFPFVSYIEPLLKKSTPSYERNVMQKYELEGVTYACIMNQFWQHKNHITAIEALKKYYADFPNSKLIVVFTGRLSDYRNPEYVRNIEQILTASPLSKHVKLLGFIKREEQIVIMKHSEFVIQPSLFEGWGTVLEDAKVLDKTVLLSDIPVHREQRNSKCIMFDPHNPSELANLIALEEEKVHTDDIEKGIADMHKRAEEYTKSLGHFLLCGEDNKNA